VQELEAKEACVGSGGCSGDDYFLALLAVCWGASRSLEQTPKKVSHKILSYERRFL
jgi:hypothetical protein